MGLADRDYMRDRRAAGYGQGRPVDRANHRAHNVVAYQPWLGFLLAFCSIGITAYRTFYNQDLPSLFRREGAPIRFPDSGSVTVSPLAMEDGPRSIFSVTVPPADPDNYVVRLDQPEDDRMVISIYVRSGDSVQVPVPAGTYSVRVSHGQRWFGAEKLFGRSTKTAKVLQPMTASPRFGTGIVFEPGSLITVEASATKFRFGDGSTQLQP